MIDGIRHVLDVGQEFNPRENVAEELLKEQMMEAIREGTDNLLRRVSSSPFIESVAKIPYDPSEDYELALRLSQQNSPVSHARQSYFVDDSPFETIQMARFAVNDLFERVNPYNRPTEEILARLDVKTPSILSPMSVRVTYGYSDSDAIYWNVPLKKNNGHPMEIEDWKERLFEILFFGPALYEHLHFWSGLRVYLSTDFVEKSGERSFSMGIHQIGDKNVCPLNILMERETEWKTFVSLPKDFYTKMKPTEVFRIIDDFIWSKLKHYLHPEVYACLNGIFDPATNTNASAIRSIEEDCSCKIRWIIEDAGSLVFSMEFKPSADEQKKILAQQRLYDFLLTYVNQSKMQLKTLSLDSSKIMIGVYYNSEISEVEALVSNDLLNLSRRHQDKGVMTNIHQIRHGIAAQFRVFDPEQLDFMTAIFNEFFSNIECMEYKLEMGPDSIMMVFRGRQNGNSTAPGSLEP